MYEPELEEVLSHHRQKAPWLCDELTKVYRRCRARGMTAKDAAAKTQMAYLQSIGAGGSYLPPRT